MLFILFSNLQFALSDGFEGLSALVSICPHPALGTVLQGMLEMKSKRFKTKLRLVYGLCSLVFNFSSAVGLNVCNQFNLNHPWERHFYQNAHS